MSQLGGVARRPSASSATTSSSVTWVKSPYHCPTATNDAGWCGQISSSTSAPSVRAASSAQTGAAKTSRAGCRRA